MRQAALAIAESPASEMFQRLDELFDELFPILCSIGGPGLRRSLDIWQ